MIIALTLTSVNVKFFVTHETPPMTHSNNVTLRGKDYVPGMQ
jgi:hypothetical protein